MLPLLAPVPPPPPPMAPGPFDRLAVSFQLQQQQLLVASHLARHHPRPVSDADNHSQCHSQVILRHPTHCLALI